MDEIWKKIDRALLDFKIAEEGAISNPTEWFFYRGVQRGLEYAKQFIEEQEKEHETEGGRL